MKTLQIKPSHESQGAFVVINAEDFNPDVHELYDPEASDASNKPEELTAAQIKEQLTAKGVPFKGNASKADLQALLDASNKPEA